MGSNSNTIPASTLSELAFVVYAETHHIRVSLHIHSHDPTSPEGLLGLPDSPVPNTVRPPPTPWLVNRFSYPNYFAL